MNQSYRTTGWGDWAVSIYYESSLTETASRQNAMLGFRLVRTLPENDNDPPVPAQQRRGLEFQFEPE